MDASPFHPWSFLVLTTPVSGVVAVLSASAYAPLQNMPTQTFFASENASPSSSARISGTAHVTLIHATRLKVQADDVRPILEIGGMLIKPRLRLAEQNSTQLLTTDHPLYDETYHAHPRELWIMDLP